ncbi:SDR family NAD(P)-dependent oxidoreductase [Paraburkholderia silvatlantica]|uniref:NAD(P)-dependent dehydrogenase (Short-subunit alcohol dehydrogenase family) n=1 Tax=Paraburkholderia silvatlantica TaxID=321895 RepID=A0A2U1A9W0_9BURK|nr:SDR family NAD(P)-dependent oxidoreductase [Paraburkholderia silvatlantica]MBB2930631.1 NAD(P)-dependent dehydrogenase (short-subunit alcohol dehydrogenase family) [Paraburkholderia silvatlantica]PVY30432.1 NADP-dependent 3-hydroxy acid dehydrogenase YdfG [Paraburkholderia silvatlantica]PXW36831.1 NADP-dependent 3-hydroxy acid dehydrogenase YdfG [Paraburkholderia silvatlantica]PYE21172.1 NADP-dependent 3-hydroxy acid dehydrogenase YdfG [Paraburkholderia silvatlantica]TDQ86687.1 NADP-depende
MRIEHSTAFVSGANRGVGAGFVAGLLARGARKVYAGMRDPDAARFDDPRVVPVRLDVTVPAQVAEAAALAGDVSLLINNAGINRLERVAEPRDALAARAEMEVNYFGTLEMCRAFAPALARNGGALVNMLSILARVALPAMGSLCASKAAALRMTEGVRAELAGRGVRVLAVLPGAIDTDMSRDFPPPKLAVTDVVDAVFAALEAGPGGAHDVYVGAMAEGVAAGLAADRAAVLAQFAAYL